ncbi:MAG: PQQ-binding-like beta-propeller repeat protein [Pirellulaceae bacterium]
MMLQLKAFFHLTKPVACVAILLCCVSGCEVSDATSGSAQGASDGHEIETPHQRTVSQADSSDWTNFRGPGYRSTTDAALPAEWGPDQGIRWRTELPGRGASSPIVSGNQVFLTAYSGFGEDAEDPGDFLDLRHHLMCLDRESGELVWEREITGTHLKQKMNPELGRHGFASSTPVTDGENVYAFFGVTGLFAFDGKGELLWQQNLGLDTHYFGSSASPILFDDLLIVNASIESKTVFALDPQTGSLKWKIPGIIECWSTPVIGMNPDGQAEMIISSKHTLSGYDPATGEQLWTCAGIQDYVVSVPIIVNGICYLTGGKEKQLIAVRLGGHGDVEESHKLWDHTKYGANVSSPIYYEGRLYVFHDSGILQIFNAEDGSLIKRSRTATSTRPFSSPLLAGDKMYMPFQDVGIGIFAASEDGDELAVHQLGDDLPLMASLVPNGDSLLIRNDRYLYCVDGSTNECQINQRKRPEDFALVNARESYNIDPERGWMRRYLLFLTPDMEATIKYVLMPYQSVITDEQTAQAREIILGEQTQYDALRERFENVQREQLSNPQADPAEQNETWAALEADTDRLNHEIRILIKQLFSEEQIQKHMADAAENKAHIKPGDQKR